MDVFVDHSSQCSGSEGILEEMGQVFGEKFGSLLTPLVVCSRRLMSPGTPRVPRLLGQSWDCVSCLQVPIRAEI